MVYAWGRGYEGQLGLGEDNLFVATPRQLRHPDLQGCVAEVECGEYFTALVTGKGFSV